MMLQVQTPTWVRAKRRIEQSPLGYSPSVPRGTVGSVEDEADGFFWVDFGEPYGVVVCDPEEVIA